MFGKSYHKMPVSSWMRGNRDQKRKLIKDQKYPMKSAIQKNLGGPLSDVFFSCLTPIQQDHIGYTPKLQGPGRDLWVSPSDILIGKVVLTPPYTSRLRQAMTHKGIMEMGAEIEGRFRKKFEVELENALTEKHKQMMKEVERMIKSAVFADRQAQQQIHNLILEKASSDLSKSYQEMLESSVRLLLEEGARKLEDAVEKTRREMEEELCLAVNSRSEYLSRQYEFQLMWRESELAEKYENQLKKQRQSCSAAMDKVQREFEAELKRTVAQLSAEHVTDLIIQGAERSQEYHEDKKQMETGFEIWFMKYFEGEIVKRDFNLLELENETRILKEKCDRREEQLRKIFAHFQQFINFALKEKPGQAEFLLSLQKELENHKFKVHEERDVEYIARLILEYIIKTIDDNSKAKGTQAVEKRHVTQSANFKTETFREMLQQEKDKMRVLRLTGEEQTATTSEDKFRKEQMKSLASLLIKNSTIIPAFSDIINQNQVDSIVKIC